MSESAGVSSSRSESGTQPKFWATVREALRGSRQDYTEGSIGRAVLLLAVPMVLEMVLESVFAVVDVFWVAHLGADAIATVGMIESMLALLYAIAIGLSMRRLTFMRGSAAARLTGATRVRFSYALPLHGCRAPCLSGRGEGGKVSGPA